MITHEYSKSAEPEQDSRGGNTTPEFAGPLSGCFTRNSRGAVAKKGGGPSLSRADRGRPALADWVRRDRPGSAVPWGDPRELGGKLAGWSARSGPRAPGATGPERAGAARRPRAGPELPFRAVSRETALFAESAPFSPKTGGPGLTPVDGPGLPRRPAGLSPPPPEHF